MATLGEYLGAGSAVTKGLFHMNGNSTDSSGNGYDGTDTNISYSLANGKLGQGALFTNSSNSYITLPTGIRQPGSFSFVGWMKPTTITSHNGSNQVVLYNEWTGTQRNYLISQKLAKLEFLSGNGASLSDSPLLTGDVLSAGIWYHFAFVRAGTTIKIYLNGVEIGTRTGSYSGGTTTSTNVRLGIDSPASSTFGYDGAFDEIIVENRAWTPVEVQKQYTNAKGRFGIV